MTAANSELVALQETLYESRNPTRRWLHCSRRDWLIDAISRHRSATHESALEVGPGSGVYLPVLARLFDRVTAIDVESAFLRNLTPLLDQHRNLTVVEDDITQSMLSSESFDLIVCTEVLEHIPASNRALMEMYRLLKPGGMLIMSTPQRYSTLEIACKVAFLPGVIDVVRMIYREPVLETGHVNLLTERQARAQLSLAGFSVLESFKSGVYIPLLAEFGGSLALRFEQWFEKALRGRSIDWLLWTQFYVATK